MPITPYSKVAFRCRNCGRLHTSADAGEDIHPHACRVCGRGVVFLSNGTKQFDSSNWEVLADASPARITELGLSTDDVEKHAGPEPSKQTPARMFQHKGKRVDVRAEDGAGTKDGVG